MDSERMDRVLLSGSAGHGLAATTDLTVLHQNDDGSYAQIYRPELFKDIKLEKMEEKKFQEEVLPKILTNFQDNLFDSLLR